MGLKDLFVKKKKEAPRPFKLAPPSSFGDDGLKPFPGPKPFSGGAPKRELAPIKEMTFPKPPQAGLLSGGPDRPKSRPLELPTVSAPTNVPEPHLFVKVDKYQQVRDGSKKLAEKLKELTGTLEKLEDLKKDEEKKLTVLRGTLKGMSDAASELDKTFRAAREEYE